MAKVSSFSLKLSFTHFFSQSYFGHSLWDYCLPFYFFIKSRYLWRHQIFLIFANFGYVYKWIVLVSVFASKMLKVRLWEQDRSSIFTCTEIHFFELKLILLFSFLFFIKSRYLWRHQIFVIFANFGYVYTSIVLVSVFAMKMLKGRLWEQDRSSIFTCTEIHFFNLEFRLSFSFLFFIKSRYLWRHQVFVILLILDMFTHGSCWYQYLHWKRSKYDCGSKIEFQFSHVQKFISLY